MLINDSSVIVGPARAGQRHLNNESARSIMGPGGVGALKSGRAGRPVLYGAGRLVRAGSPARHYKVARRPHTRPAVTPRAAQMRANGPHAPKWPAWRRARPPLTLGPPAGSGPGRRPLGARPGMRCRIPARAAGAKSSARPI